MTEVEKNAYLLGVQAGMQAASDVCLKMIVGGRQWTEGQAIAAEALTAASNAIKDTQIEVTDLFAKDGIQTPLEVIE